MPLEVGLGTLRRPRQRSAVGTHTGHRTVIAIRSAPAAARWTARRPSLPHTHSIRSARSGGGASKAHLPPPASWGKLDLHVSTEQIIGFSIAILLMLIGLAGCLLPILPGTPILLAAAVVHRLYFGDTGPSLLVLGIMTLLTILSLIFDQLASMFGAKRMGATWKGVTGAVVGGLIGLFFSLPGILLGPFIGATVFELFGDREFRDALRAGVGATLGLLLGAVGKVAVSMVMILMFSWSVVSRSMAAAEPAPETPPAIEQPAPTNHEAMRANLPAADITARPGRIHTAS